MDDACVFCEIARGAAPASIVCEDALHERDRYAAMVREYL